MSLFRFKINFFVLIFLFIIFSVTKSYPSSSGKCQNGENFINGKCIKITFDSIPEAKIDEQGIYKYVQIKCNDTNIFIRGSKDFSYHKEIYKNFLQEVELNHLDSKLCTPLGGGRIKKFQNNKKIKIFGYSKTYGRAENQHETTKKILQKYYPDYEITWKNAGY